MDKLNITEGEWTLNDHTQGGSLKVMSGKKVVAYLPDVEFNSCYVENAYLIAQAKNMYEQLKSLSELMPFLDEQTHPNIELDVVKYDIDKLLNACKPPEER